MLVKLMKKILFFTLLLGLQVSAFSNEIVQINLSKNVMSASNIVQDKTKRAAITATAFDSTTTPSSSSKRNTTNSASSDNSNNTESAASNQTSTSQAKKVQIGIYIMNIYDINWHKEMINVEFWIWYKYKDIDFDFKDSMDIINAADYEVISESTTLLPKGEKVTAIKYRAKLLADWDFLGFPLETLSMNISFEPLTTFADQMGFTLQKDPLKVSDKINLLDWNIGKKSISIKDHHYDTSFGNRAYETKGSSFSQVRVEIDFLRKGLRLFFQLFSVLYLSYFLSLASFFIPITELNSKVGLIIGSIFALIGNNFVMQSMLPPVGQFTLVDKIEILTFLCVIFAVVVMIITRYFFRMEWKTTGRKVDIICGVVSLCIFIVLNFVFITKALA